ncbi:MAG: S46 family peptidase [Bacteroidetes bacterium]|nr:MAG: S46 family peptidase [Bacteroidota bacterium]
MKTRFIALLALITLSFGSRADEGMWLPFMIGRNYEDMKKHGLNLSAEDIYSINNSSLKDAVISFGGFCTGEIISDKGLVLTNHHCGYDAIAGASTKEHNYLDNGFWAKAHDQEIPIPGLTATFIIRIEDVTELINKELNESMSEEERSKKIAEISKILQDDAVNGTHYKAFVRDFFEGNEFYLFVQETYQDVRLVGTPPQSSGKFGGDTDNWMWPRHTADFSMFRIYAGADNKPAAFSESNQPMVPRHSLPISLKGVQENDFAMIMGFPGSTDRYLSSYGVRQAITLEQPKRVDVRAKKLEIMKSYMDQDVAVRLKYSSKYAQVANYWKYFIGQTEQVKNNDVIGKKESLEQEYRNYMANKKIGFPVLEAMDDYYNKTNPIVNIKVYQSEFIYTVDMNVSAYRYKFWLQALEGGDEARAGMFAGRLGMMTNEFFENANMEIEMDILEEVLKMYIKDVPADQMGPITKKIALKGDKGVEKYVKKVLKKSIFANKARFEAFNSRPDRKVLEKDPLFVLIMDMDEAYQKATGSEDIKKATDALEKANRFFVAAIRDMQPNKLFYPNANSTMRLTYGNVLPYEPRDGVTYHYTTSIDGIMQKEDPSNPEFNVDPVMKELWKKKDYGQYADANGNLTVNFLTNNDITGGNSGSPVINGDGQLIGTAFDGNWEAMSGDIYFEPNIQRTISVDIRYTLWIVDKCYGATNLIDEMNIIK